MPAEKPHSGTRPAIPGKLSPGMRLPRELVAESQQARLSIALVELVDSQGFADTSLADLSARAHVARAAFYEHYGSLEACFTAAYDEQLARATGQLVSAYNAPDLEDEQRAQAALGALAGIAQVWPAAARMCLADVLTVAQGTIEAREQELEGVHALLDRTLGAEGAHRSSTPLLVVATLGAIRRAMYVQLRERPARELPALAEQLSDWLGVYAQEPPPVADRRGVSGEGLGVEGLAADVDGAVRVDVGAEGDALDDGPKERILRAVLSLAADGAGESISLAEIAAAASTSFGTFYKHFRTAQEALLDACEGVHERLYTRAREAAAAADNWVAGIDAGLRAYLAAAAEEPLQTRTMVLGSLSLGKPGLEFLEQRARSFEQLLRPGLNAHRAPPSASLEMLCGAILEVVHDHALRGCVERLPEVAGQLVEIVLAPLLVADGGEPRVGHTLDPVHASSLASSRARARG